MNEQMQKQQNQDGPTTGPMSTTGLPPAPIPEWQERQFRRLLDRLAEWRSDDHEDAIVLCRSEIIAILEGVKSVQNHSTLSRPVNAERPNDLLRNRVSRQPGQVRLPELSRRQKGSAITICYTTAAGTSRM